MDITQNLAKYVLEHGGSVHPLIIDSSLTNGTGLMNPSVANINGEILCILRHVNYTFYHSENKVFQHPWGPLTYIHPENDLHLRTENYLLKLDPEKLIPENTHKIITSDFDNYEPLWDFVGLEDARLVYWNNSMFICGVRRDTTINGQGRMEVSEISYITKDTVKEVDRNRIPTPNNVDTYCEKNWMPLEDNPFHFIKWTNPTELVFFDKDSNTCISKFVKPQHGNIIDMRGGSQVIPWNDGYLCIIHEVIFLKSDVGRKDAIYRHRFVQWDKDFNILRISRDFSLMNAHIEFAAGMCKFDDENTLISFGFQDNAAFIMKIKNNIIDKLLKDQI